MLLQNKDKLSTVPFVMYKPGIYATMDVRFFTSWIDWRASYVFKYPDTRDIESIKVDFLQDSITSFAQYMEDSGQVRKVICIGQYLGHHLVNLGGLISGENHQ